MRLRSIAMLTCAVIAFAACGSDDNADSDDTTTTSADEHAAEHADSGDHGEHPAETSDTADDAMDHSDTGDMDHGDALPAKPAAPLPTLADGTLDPAGVDLSGIDGVTTDQQAYAETLLLDTIETLPKWADYDTAIADGFESIGDGLTGEEHVIHWDWINDEVVLDPAYPESLVYRVDRATGAKTLEAAMFLLPERYTLDNAPTDGGALMQYHIHNNLCFTAPPAPHVAGLTNAEGGCEPPLVFFNPNVMVHVWIRQNECGPFAALKGVGGGQIAEGESVTCLQDHGELGL